MIKTGHKNLIFYLITASLSHHVSLIIITYFETTLN